MCSHRSPLLCKLPLSLSRDCTKSIADSADTFTRWWTLPRRQLVLWALCCEASLALSDGDCECEFRGVKEISEELHERLGPKPGEVSGKFLSCCWWALYCVQEGLI